MRPVTVTVSARTSAQGSAASNWVLLDRTEPWSGISVVVNVSGTAKYTVQHTLSDVAVSAASPRVFNHESLVALTSSEDGNYGFPVVAVRLMSIPATGYSGNVEMTVIQAGS